MDEDDEEIEKIIEEEKEKMDSGNLSADRNEIKVMNTDVKTRKTKTRCKDAYEIKKDTYKMKTVRGNLRSKNALPLPSSYPSIEVKLSDHKDKYEISNHVSICAKDRGLNIEEKTTEQFTCKLCEGKHISKQNSLPKGNMFSQLSTLIKALGPLISSAGCKKIKMLNYAIIEVARFGLHIFGSKISINK